MAGTVRLADYVMRFVADQGVRHVFALTGGGAMHLNDAAGNCPGLQCVFNLHEQACAVAAEAYAKYDNRLGVALVTVGPGATNTITGLAAAWLDSTPVLFLSGQVKRGDRKGDSGVRNRGVQEIDIIPIVRPLTKYAATVSDPATVRYHLEKAVRLARSGRPGPVWVEVPLDVQAAQIAPDALVGYGETAGDSATTGADGLRDSVARVVARLRESQRPFLLLGNGVRLAGALPEARRLLDRLAVPFGLTWPAMDFVADSHPRLVGRPGPMAPRAANFALQNADFLLSVGARLDLVCTAFAPERLARGAWRAMVDIDAAEIAKLQPYLHAGICADAGAFLRELLAQLGGSPAPGVAAWLARCEAWKARYPLRAPTGPSADGPVSVALFTRRLSAALPEDALVTPGSSGSAVELFLLHYAAKAGQRVYLATGLGSMGFGVPASIGACLAHGCRPTVCIEGDGGFQMNAQELETIARLRLPVKLFVANNGGYGSIVTMQKAFFRRLVGSTPESGLTFPDTLKLAAAYGLPTACIRNEAELDAGLCTALRSDGPCVCEVMTLPEEPREPRVSSFQRADGSMASRPLEDMYPFLPREEFRENMIVPPLPEE